MKTKTLRDEFAMAALQLLLNVEAASKPWNHITDEMRARRAYELADAMMLERNK